MPSWRARGLTLAIRMLMRRADWGDPPTLVRRARRLFGAPNPLQWLRTRGVRIRPVSKGTVRGEWVAADQSDPDLGVVLYLHGGGYVAGSPATHRPITAALARLARRRVFSLDYRLAPEHRFPAALDDAAAAYRWLLEQGTPASSLVLAGDSAGGGLVLATLLKVREEGWPAPACAACFSPWTDLAATGESARENDGRCAMLRPDSISAFARLYLGDTPPQHPYASPVYADLGGLPPLLLQVGSDELLLDDTRRIHAKIQAAGGPSTLQIFDGVFHGWHVLAPLLPESRQALHQAAHFLNTPHAPPTRPGRPMPSAQAPPRAGTK